MSDVNKELQAAEKKLEGAAAELTQAADALQAGRLVEAVVDDAVPDLSPDPPKLEEAPPVKRGSLDEVLSALAENAARTKFDEEVAEAES